MGELQVDVTDEFNASTGVRVATVDNGDGTGTRTTFDADGNPETVEQLSGLPIPEPAPPDPLTTLLARLADARSLEEVRQAAQEATQP